MRDLTADEIRTLLTEGARLARIGVITPGGLPNVTPIWFWLDDGDIVFTTWHTSVKYRSMSVDPHVSLVVDDDRPPYAFVQVNGTVTMSDDLEEIRHFATLIGGRYMGADRAAEFGARNAVPGEYLVRLSPTRIIAKTDISD